MSSTIGSFNTQLLKLLKGELKYFTHKKCQLELIQGSHPLPAEMVEDLDGRNYSYIRVSRLDKKSSDDIEEHDTSNGSTDDLANGVAGSPLSFDVSNLQLNGSHLNLPEDKNAVKSVASVVARELISLYNLACRDLESKDILRPMWVYCDGLSNDNIAFLGSFVRPLPTDVGKFITDGTMVTIKGPFSRDHKFPSVAELFGKSLNKKQNRLKYSSRYSLFGTSAHDELEDELLRLGSVDVLFQWDGYSGVLCDPPPDASAVLSVNISAGNPGLVVHNLYMDLITLQGFVDGLVGRLVKWAVPDNGVCSIFDQVKQFVEDQKTVFRPDIPLQFGSSSGDDPMTLKDVLVKERLDLDFTELLWKILRNCTSCKELTDSLHYVLTNIQKKELQPMVHRDNKCRLAGIIRDSFHDKLTNLPLLEGLTSVEFLIEIGFEKLFRDYSTAFLGSDLVTAGHLSQFVGCSGSGKMLERFRCLEKLHLVLEIVTLLDQSLTLPRLTLSSIARQALKYYEVNEIKATDVFSVPVAMQSVVTLLAESYPKMWKAVLSSDQGASDVDPMVVLSTSSPFLHFSPNLSGTDDLSDGKSAKYFLTVVDKFQVIM